MSQYFRPRRVITASPTSEPPIPLHSFSTNDLHHNDGSDIDFSNHRIASSAILIFPNPPSEQDSSRSAAGSGSGFEFSGSSTLSLPTDMSLESVRSMSRSRSRGDRERLHNRNERRQSLLPTFFRDSDWHELLPEEQEQEQFEWELGSGYLRPDHTRSRNSFHHRRHARNASGLSSPLILPFTLSPQPPLRLPFLSFLQSFLTLDESTLHLISRSPDPHLSSLFPISPGPHSYSHSLDDNEAVSADGADPPHGALKLLLSNPDKPQSTALLKAGIDPSEMPGYGNPLLVSPTQISVWRLLEFLIEGGVRAWKEIRAWDTGNMRLIGV